MYPTPFDRYVWPISLKLSVIGEIVIPLLIAIKRPLNINNPAKVTTNDGILANDIKYPLNNPIKLPNKIAIIITGKVPIPYHACKTAQIAPINPIKDPTDKSIFPVIITNVIPVPKIAIIETCLDKFDKFLIAIKVPPVIIIKNIHIKINAIYIEYCLILFILLVLILTFILLI
jgi:hypothetical protein